MDNPEDFLKPEEVAQLADIAAQRKALLKEKRRIQDRAWRRMYRAHHSEQRAMA